VILLKESNMILSDRSLLLIKPVKPFVLRTEFVIKSLKSNLGDAIKRDVVMTYGLGPAGYDIRVAEDVWLAKSMFATSMGLFSSIEEFNMPDDVMGVVHDKSSWARRGLSVFNTVIEPGWRGYLTLELKNHSDHVLKFPAGTPIAQVVFHKLDQPCMAPYNGKYQDQEKGPQRAR
jgi:dCTP deaminase